MNDIVIVRTQLSREETIARAKVKAESAGKAVRKVVNRGAVETKFGARVTSGVVAGFVRGLFSK